MKDLRCFVVPALLLATLALGCEDSTRDTAPALSGPTATFDPGASAAPDGGTAAQGADAGGSPVRCPTPSGPTMHGPTAQTETWTAAGSPHIVANDLNVTGQLTLEPCAEVLIAADKVITVVGPTSALVANGTATQPIHIGARDAGKPFGKLTNDRNGTLHLSYVTIDGGGVAGRNLGDASPAAAGTVELAFQGSAVRAELLFVDHVTVGGSASNGVVLRDGATFAGGSKDLVVRGSTLHPMRLAASTLDGLPTGDYTGNTKDELAIVSNDGDPHPFGERTTLRDLGVPYHVLAMNQSVLAGSLAVEGFFSAASNTLVTPTLVIEPGVTIRFDRGGSLRISSVVASPNVADATLIAVGTAKKPIVFTSAEAAPAAGDWIGVSFAGAPQPLSRLAFVRVAYAGRASSILGSSCVEPGQTTDAAVQILGAPASQFITDTVIADSSSNGIDRSWQSDAPIDFLAGNTFSAVTGCNQTMTRNRFAGCPLPLVCPK